MPQINRIRVNNVKYNFGTQMYDDFILRPFGRNMLYDLANGGGKSVLMLLMLQTVIPNCTLDEKQPVEKLFRTGDGSQTIHSLIEWRLDPSCAKKGFRYMTAGFCARKASQDVREGEEAKDSASIEYFNYCIFYRDYNDSDIRNLPLVKNREKITYNGLRRYLKDLEKDSSLEVRLFDRKGEYQKFLSGYGLYESTWELIRGINKTEGHVRTYFETNYKTTRKVVEDLLIEEIIQKSFLQKTDGADAEDSMARTLLDMRDQLAELARRKEEIGRFDRQAELLGQFGEQMGGLKELYLKKAEYETELTKTYEGAKYFYESRMRDCEMRKQGIDALSEEILGLEARLACARLCGDKNRAAQMVLEIEMLAGSLETIRNRQAKETFSLQMKESMNDYLEYQEEKKKRDEVAETIRAMQDKNVDRIGELKLLTWHMKQRMDVKKKRLEGELARLSADWNKSKELLGEYDTAFRQLERRQAVAESRIADYKDERKNRLSRMAAYKGEAGVLVAEEAKNAGKRLEEEAKASDNQKTELLLAAEKLQKEEAEVLAVLSGLFAKKEALAQERKEAEEFEQAYQEKRSRVLKFLRIYKKGTLEEAAAELKNKELETIREEYGLQEELAKITSCRNNMEAGKWPSGDGVPEKLKSYVWETFQEEAQTGSEYLQNKDETEQRELIARYPFLPSAVIAREGYDRLACDEGLRGMEWLRGCVPVIREELLERKEDLFYKGRMFLLTGETTVFLDAEKYENEKKRLEEEAGRLKEAIGRLAERREAYAADAALIQEFVLHWEQEYARKHQRAEECRASGEELEVRVLEEENRKVTVRERKETLKSRIAALSVQIAEKEAAVSACKRLAQEYGDYLQTENALSEEEAFYKKITGEMDVLREKLSVCEEKAKELSSLCAARKDSLSEMEKDWQEKYSSYYEDGLYPDIRMTDEELEAKLNGRRTAALQEYSELEDKNRLVNSYISAMNRCLRSITTRGISMADLTERHEKNELYVTGEEEIGEIRKLLNSLAKEIQSKEKALELLRADWNRLDGSNQRAAEEIKNTYGSYEELNLPADEAEEYITETEGLLDKRKAELNGARIGLDAAMAEIRDYEDVKKDIERMLKNTGIALETQNGKVADDVDLREHFKEVESKYEKQLKRLSREQENFYGRKEKLTAALEEECAHPLAEEIRTSMKMPSNAEETVRMLNGISEIIDCLALEKERIESSIGELKSMKENFESQCLQRCMNIRTELERLPKLSRILLDGNLIPIISLTVPYVKEEFFKERMSSYIDEVVKNADGAENERDRLKGIRQSLAWKKLFSVIVTDMNAIRLTLYKRERVKEQSRHLRYEEAVGSTGQSQGIYIQFLIAVINYIASINSAEGETAGLTKVLFIDNPFGAAKDIYIWEPIFELLKTNHVQLIVPARGTTPAITGRFDVNYVLGQKLVDGKQLTVVTDYVSRVDTGEMEYAPLRYEQLQFAGDTDIL